MNPTLAACLLTAIAVSIAWLWLLRRFIRVAQRVVERKDAIISEMHADLIVARGLNEIGRRYRERKDPADWWRDAE